MRSRDREKERGGVGHGGGGVYVTLCFSLTHIASK